MRTRWVEVVGWDTFQHYTKRRPIWIKNYVELLAKDEYRELTGHQRGVLHGLWMLYASSECQVRVDTASISRQLGVRVSTAQLESLSDAGFIRLRASKPLALARARERQKREASKEASLSKKVKHRSPSKNGDAPPGEREQLLARAEQMAVSWRGGSSEEFDANLDTLEGELHAHLSYAQRSRLWDVALEQERRR